MIVKKNNKNVKVCTLCCITCVTLCGSNHCTQPLYLHSENISPTVVALSIASNVFALRVIPLRKILYSLSGCVMIQPMVVSLPNVTTDEMYYEIDDQMHAGHETIN